MRPYQKLPFRVIIVLNFLNVLLLVSFSVSYSFCSQEEKCDGLWKWGEKQVCLLSLCLPMLPSLWALPWVVFGRGHAETYWGSSFSIVIHALISLIRLQTRMPISVSRDSISRCRKQAAVSFAETTHFFHMDDQKPTYYHCILPALPPNSVLMGQSQM